MNNSMNYSNFVDLLLKNDDDNQLVGISTPVGMYTHRGNKPELYTRQESAFLDDIDRWLSE